MIGQCLLFVFFFSSLLGGEISSLPISHQGRFRPLGDEQPLHDELKMLPSKKRPEIWLSLKLLKEGGQNPTLFSDSAWKKLQEAYQEQNSSLFASTYFEAYNPLTNQTYSLSKHTSLQFPSENRLQAELWFRRTPLASIAIAAYLFALFVFLLPFKIPYLGKASFIFAFICHTVLLGAKIYILQRPPVSNMADTLIYVPWIAALLAFIFQELFAASAGLAAILLTILEWTLGSYGLENVQPVLNSQFWLIIHVLMIVASYGLFILAGIIGHISLIRKKKSKILIQLIYLGLALLIPGTILGGVWAAMSWGRFWDWDPKESWAFISACIYLLVVHAYRFHYIGAFGVAVGSILGLLAISFTWYGVNYILGTGLHSYGFGAGGGWFYFAYVIVECLFLTYFLTWGNKSVKKTKNLADNPESSV